MVQRGQRELSQNLARKNLYTNLQSERCDCAIEKKTGFRHFFRLLKTRYPLSTVSSLSFLLFVKWLIDAFLEMKLCILLFMRSTQYTGWNPGFQRGKETTRNERKKNKKKNQKKKIPKQQISLFKTSL